jgi:hypothetical protein
VRDRARRPHHHLLRDGAVDRRGNDMPIAADAVVAAGERRRGQRGKPEGCRRKGRTNTHDELPAPSRALKRPIPRPFASRKGFARRARNRNPLLR